MAVVEESLEDCLLERSKGGTHESVDIGILSVLSRSMFESLYLFSMCGLLRR